MCYEAGYDAFWLARFLKARGIACLVVDPTSLQVNRRSRRAKTDRIDVGMLLRALIAWCRGERHVWSIVRIPSVDEEDLRRSHRERSRLIRERTAHINRIKGLLFGQGIRGLNIKTCYKRLELEKLVTGEGRPLPPRLTHEIAREIERLAMIQEHLAVVERELVEAPTPCQASEKKRAQLLLLKGIGPVFSAVMAREIFYRQFDNRRQVAGFLGLVTSPYDSGAVERSQGISRGRQRRRKGDDDPGRLAVDQASAQERAHPMVLAPNRGPGQARETDHDCRAGAQAGDRLVALSRTGPGSRRCLSRRQMTPTPETMS